MITEMSVCIDIEYNEINFQLHTNACVVFKSSVVVYKVSDLVTLERF